MRKEGAALRNGLILGATILVLVVAVALLAKYFI